MKTTWKQRAPIALLSLLVIIGGGSLIYYAKFHVFTPAYPNVLLVTIDALRPDHLGCYGYPKNTSPNIDKLAREGVMFTQAIAQSSWTWPSINSLISSTYPSTNGVFFWDQVLSESISTLPQILRKENYYTFFISTHEAIKEFGGQFENCEDLSSQPNAKAEIIEKVTLAVQSDKKRPFFIWAHYMDTHSLSYCELPVNKRSSVDLDKETIAKYSLKYDNAIKDADNQIEALLEKLKVLGVYKNTIIIISADHGESLGEHSDYFTHGGTLFNYLIRVPLIINCPGLLPGNIIAAQQVQLIDIAPTICDMLGIKIPKSFEGKSLLSILKGNGKEESLHAFSELKENLDDKFESCYSSKTKWNYTMFSIRGSGFQLMRTLDSQQDRYELYNLIADSEELDNVVAARKEVFWALKAELEKWMSRSRPRLDPASRLLDEKAKEKLRNLGYLQ